MLARASLRSELPLQPLQRSTLQGTLLAMSLIFALQVVTSGLTFTCTPTRVWDVNGPIWCEEGPRVRLAGIAAREADGTCRPQQPCPQASAQEARDHLVSLLGDPIGHSREGHVLIRGEPMECRSTGSAGGSRTAAWCVQPDLLDLSCAMVESGLVLKWDRYWRTTDANRGNPASRCQLSTHCGLVPDARRLSERET
jgi:endonuclease YncB( thermonuclease family)